MPLQSYFGPIRVESVICTEILFGYPTNFSVTSSERGGKKSYLWGHVSSSMSSLFTCSKEWLKHGEQKSLKCHFLWVENNSHWSKSNINHTSHIFA